MTTLYEKFGGDTALQAVVEAFYRKMLADDDVARFFDKVDMEGQIAKQKAFLAIALGGPNNYTGRDMNTSHAKMREMGMDDSHVDKVKHYLSETLRDFEVGEDDIATVASVVESLRDQVMGRAE